MGESRSIRSSSRARTTERGFALAMALVLAVLYFGLIELLLIDASRDLAEARRFRARVVALTLAENAAERAALKIAEDGPKNVDIRKEDEQGKMHGNLMKNEGGERDPFRLSGEGETVGLVRVKARVDLVGEVEGTKIRITFAKHTQ
jgi:Tfp pilus assembly protein PilX